MIEKVNFTTHSIQLEKDDVIYLYSDDIPTSLEGQMEKNQVDGI
jgi:serine phosphatase RsbU (regulator of sigma subunit)